MRPGIIIAIVAGVIVVIGGIYWYNDQSEQVLLEEQRTEQAAQAEREEERTREEQAAREEEAAASEQAAIEEEEAAGADDAAIVVGDEITDDTTVVQSTTGEPTILDPDDTTTTANIVDEAEAPDSAASLDADAQAGNGDSTTEGAGEGVTQADELAETSTTTEPEELLTPANFDRDEVLALIEDSDQVNAEQRSSLRALVEGASANPEMVDAAIKSIRTALDLPSLN